MLTTRLDWRTNLRTNLLLWPTVGENIRNLALQDGAPYDEDALLEGLKQRARGRDVTDPRAVRNTFEILALAGLAYRTNEAPPSFRLTPLGRSAFRFLGVGVRDVVANPANIHLLGRHFVRGLSTVVETRAIWMLMRASRNGLSNEELNRSMARIEVLGDAPAVGAEVLRGRDQGNPTIIGPRIYEDAKYGTPQANDQRKVMNVLFLLAGAGGMLISVGDGDERRLAPWAIPLIDEALAVEQPLIHASTDSDSALHISRSAGAPDVEPIR